MFSICLLHWLRSSLLDLLLECILNYGYAVLSFEDIRKIMRSGPLLLSDDVAADDITYTHLCTACVLKKSRSEQAKNTLFDRERLLTGVCTCSTLAN